MKSLSVIIVDDHQLFREGLKLLLKSLPDTGIVEEASDGREFLDYLKSGNQPDIVFMDIEMPGLNGIETTKEALRIKSELNIIALSMYSDENYYTQMIDAGVKGFILKNSGIQEVKMAIDYISEGKTYFAQEILDCLLKQLKPKQEQASPLSLTEREEEILHLICNGLSNQEIADKLKISKRTVDKHRENLLSKSGSNNTAGLVVFAIKNGIVEI
ncbi:response regulator [Saccharicrinis sp. FJH2]|uniref:response regulator n=1 Tax=Saccharicrinis sp. FJH65 TaxID=3344659 RepID=UPI0035F4913E